MNNKKIHNGGVCLLSVLLALVLSGANSSFADVRLPAIIGDNMVLQRGQAAVIWGWAEPNETITVSWRKPSPGGGSWNSDSRQTTAGKDGKWMVKIEPPTAADSASSPQARPYEMTISGKNTIVLKNILVGEVWICSGQSNMEMGIGLVNNARQEIAAADYPQIRLFHVALRSSGQPQTDVEGSWKVCSPENISTGNIWEGWPKGFSAVAYFFGRELHKELGVPVGLICSAWGGTPIEPWTPPVGFTLVEELADMTKQIEQADVEYQKEIQKAIGQFEQWEAAAKKALEEGKTAPSPPAWPKHALDNSKKPTGLYNAMIHPLAPFAIRGAIWYQGEANLADGMRYCEKMKALIGGWRKVWGQGDFPFYYVQLAPYRYRWGPPSPYRLPEIWKAQTTALSIPNTGMAATIDISDLDDIHPKNKQGVGRRLALWALAKTYGRSELIYSGPAYKSMAVEGDKIRISFDHIGSGLTTGDGREPTWFEIADEDKNFVQAQAKIEDDTVVVWSDKVPKPAMVRFGWHEEAEPGLMNKEGLPAWPFRTDDWPVIMVDKK
jgi:sialate O-acetylesterase